MVLNQNSMETDNENTNQNEMDSLNNPGTQNSNTYNLQTQIKNIDSIFEPEPEEHAFTHKDVNSIKKQH